MGYLDILRIIKKYQREQEKTATSALSPGMQGEF